MELKEYITNIRKDSEGISNLTLEINVLITLDNKIVVTNQPTNNKIKFTIKK